jgi:hypothetical protein
MTVNHANDPKRKIFDLKNQYLPEMTPWQILFDVLFGIIGPILCLFLDPGFFSNLNDFNGGLFSSLQVFVYSSISFGCIILLLWLVLQGHVGGWQIFFRNAFIYGTWFAWIIGIPMAFFAVQLLISPTPQLAFLGFLPVIAGWVFYRNARRTNYKEGNKNNFSGAIRIGIAISELILVIGIPIILQWQANNYVSHSISEILSTNQISMQKGIKELSGAFWCNNSCYKPLQDAYVALPNNSPEKKSLWSAYYQLTRKDLDNYIDETYIGD